MRQSAHLSQFVVLLKRQMEMNTSTPYSNSMFQGLLAGEIFHLSHVRRVRLPFPMSRI